MTKAEAMLTLCKTCSGTGMVPLKPELAQTLDALHRMGKAAHASQIKKFLRCKITVNGISNRLDDLYQLRLVRRERHGKFLLYTPTR